MDKCETCHYSDRSALGRCSVCKWREDPPGIDNWVPQERVRADDKHCGNCDSANKTGNAGLCGECQSSGDFIHWTEIRGEL